MHIISFRKIKTGHGLVWDVDDFMKYLHFFNKSQIYNMQILYTKNDEVLVLNLKS
eukprot:UN09794